MSTAELIDGNAIAAQIRVELKESVRVLQETLGVTPGLAVVLIGERRDSATYVRMKKKACAEIGINSFGFDYPASTTEAELLAKVDELNQDPQVNGILVQLPLPAHINEQNVLNRILPEKDVDGLHPLNVAQLANTKTHAPGRGSWSFDTIDFHTSCTPQGCIELLDRSGVAIEGKEAVVIGRSNIVGIPVAMLLMQRNATVTIAHSRTRDIAEVVRRADIVVAAVGRAEFVRGEWIKPGAVVIDVGINSVDDPSDKRGYRLVGDVNFEECRAVASRITPVPGGVGPMTIAMLLRNTVNGARRTAIATQQSLPVPPTDA
jgi:5,10-methylene-tetrahydrofolate dehydrogenase/methenyl tetrahydrofolate cyclohydrolase